MGREDERWQPYLGQLQPLFIYLKTAKPVFEGEGERASRQARTAGRSEGGEMRQWDGGRAGRGSPLPDSRSTQTVKRDLMGSFVFY